MAREREKLPVDLARGVRQFEKWRANKRHSRSRMEVLFTLFAERYERGSIMLTSNLPFSKWEAIFKDPMTTAAAIDRLVHHSVILELNLPSYRLEQAKNAKGESTAEEPTTEGT